jgi:hypothetical protein
MSDHDLTRDVMKAMFKELDVGISPHVLLRAASAALSAVHEHAKNISVSEFFADLDSAARRGR